jgi:hypothetical protein
MEIDHTHPDHTCQRCRDEENQLRPGWSPRRRQYERNDARRQYDTEYSERW